MNAVTERVQDFKALLTLVCSLFVGLFGWLGVAFALLVAAMATDYITGTIAARSMGEWSSSVARAGLRHKLGEILAVGAAAFADLGVDVVIRSEAFAFLPTATWPKCFTMIVIFWYLFTEIGSIIENAGEMGAPVPSWLARGVAVLKARIDQAGEKETPGARETGGKHLKEDKPEE